MAEQSSIDDDRNVYAGWIAGLLIMFAILAAGGVIWFTYHP
jgi:hypothetical protein